MNTQHLQNKLDRNLYLSTIMPQSKAHFPEFLAAVLHCSSVVMFWDKQSCPDEFK